MSVPCCRDTSLQQALDTFWKNGSIELNKTPRTHGSKTTSEKINKKPKPHRNTHTYTHTGLETTKLLSWSSQARAQSNPEFVAGHQTRLFMKLDRAWGVWQRERGKLAVFRHASWDGQTQVCSRCQKVPLLNIDVNELCNQLLCILSLVLI